jgi:acyl carrier protein
VPSSFVILESLPLSPHGKVDRQALPPPGIYDVDLGGEYVAPSTPIEEDVARIFGAALGIDDIGIYDDFFDLGGHSLLVTQVVSRVNSAFQIELPVRALFDAPTVSGVVAAIVESQVGQSEDNVLSQMLAELELLSDDEVDAAFSNGAAL